MAWQGVSGFVQLLSHKHVQHLQIEHNMNTSEYYTFKRGQCGFINVLFSFHYFQNNGCIFFQMCKNYLIHVIMLHAFVIIPLEDDHVDGRNMLGVVNTLDTQETCCVLVVF